MLELTKKEMDEVSGGGISWGIASGIIAGIIFIIGLIDGYTNPKKCRN